MDQKEISYYQESRIEDKKTKQFSEKSRQVALKIYGTFVVLDIDSKITQELKKDIDSGEIYNIFHLYHENASIRQLKVVYSFYKEKIKGK